MQPREWRENYLNPHYVLYVKRNIRAKNQPRIYFRKKQEKFLKFSTILEKAHQTKNEAMKELIDRLFFTIKML